VEDRDGGQVEQRSRVKITRNAKGEAQFEVSVVSGQEVAELVRIRELAVAQYRALEEELGRG
jgi:hypothetical protein